MFTLVLIKVTVKVIAVAVMELTAVEVPFGISLMFLVLVVLPVSRMVTEAAVLNSNPGGALRMIAPNPISPPLLLPSTIVGPVRAVHEPVALQPGAVLEAIAPPPVAATRVAAAAIPLKASNPNKRKIVFAKFFI